MLLHGIVTAADVQDRDGGLTLLASLFGLFPFLRKLFADSAYQGPIFHRALADILPHLETKIVKRSDRVTGFVVLPKRWIVERSPEAIYLLTAYAKADRDDLTSADKKVLSRLVTAIKKRGTDK